ncbi:MAG TPA: serine hydrolase, partial [Vicinamibacteria bacterium]|nr:serine hydrolase [Vicinamibacteria bacterium]
MKTRFTTCASALLAVLALGSRALADEAHPTPRFTQADRKEKLAAAFPEIERDIAARMAADHLPGLAFGIVIDGELVYGKG